MFFLLCLFCGWENRLWGVRAGILSFSTIERPQPVETRYLDRDSPGHQLQEAGNLQDGTIIVYSPLRSLQYIYQKQRKRDLDPMRVQMIQGYPLFRRMHRCLSSITPVSCNLFSRKARDVRPTPIVGQVVSHRNLPTSKPFDT